MDLNKFKAILHIGPNVVKNEIDEIKQLTITEEDKQQGEALALAIYSACAIYGIPCPKSLQEIAALVCAYGVRDAKDGLKTPNKLIIGRVVDEFKDVFKNKYHSRYK